MKWFLRTIVMTFCIGATFILAQPTSVAAEEFYPWCTQGEVLQCYYATREQCELTVDYRGFCVANPEMPPSPTRNFARRSRSVQRPGREGRA